MSDTQIETATGQEADPVRSALAALQADNAALAAQIAERDARLSDASKGLARLADADAELARLRGIVEAGTRRERGDIVVARVRDALPHLSDFETRAVLGALHEEGKVDRYSEKPDAAAVAAVELIKARAPVLSRPPMAQGGGPNGAPTQPAPRRHSPPAG